MDLLSALNAHGVRYLVVGGYAFGTYCQPRATKDLDIYVMSSAENGKAVFHALADFGAPLPDLTAADFCDGTSYFQIGQPPLRVDVLQVLSGISFEESWAERISVQVNDGFEVPVISLTRLIQNKLAAGRPRDLLDVEELGRAAELLRRT